MRILFLGHQEIGRRCLSALLGVGADVCLVVGHDGLGSLAPLALSHGIAFQCVDKSPETWHWSGSDPGWIISVYFRYLVPESMLKAVNGAMNIHCSLLPAYRGCAPINWAILNGETRVGVTLHDMVAAADAGAIVDQIPYDIQPHQNAGDVMDKLSDIAADMVVRQFLLVKAGQVTRVHQALGDYPMYRRRTPKDGLIDWRWSARRIHNLVRAVSPAHLYGGATTPGGQIITHSCLAVGEIPPGYVRVKCGANQEEFLDVLLKN